jgi:hypothetical protein
MNTDDVNLSLHSDTKYVPNSRGLLDDHSVRNDHIFNPYSHSDSQVIFVTSPSVESCLMARIVTPRRFLYAVVGCVAVFILLIVYNMYMDLWVRKRDRMTIGHFYSA